MIRAQAIGAVAVAFSLVSGTSIVAAQGVEVAPFAGYRFGGDLFEIVTGQRLDTDGAPAAGVVVDVRIADDYQIEGLFTRQQTDVPVATLDGVTRLRVVVDQWQGGGLRELRGGVVRPFLTGTLGLTRMASDAASEIRFAIAAGGGVKLLPARHVGVRLDGRLFTTFVDADSGRAGTGVGVCTPGLCFSTLAFHVVWQVEFTAALVVRFR